MALDWRPCWLVCVGRQSPAVVAMPGSQPAARSGDERIHSAQHAPASGVPVFRYCIFCEIAAHREEADILFEDDEVMVFRNRLRWVPVMLLAMPKQHGTQAELWREMGRVGEVAVRVATENCPNGFRLLSNFGYDGMQSQDHAHVHILGGMFLGEYA